MDEQYRRETEEHPAQRAEEFEEISLREIIDVVLKGKKFIALLLVICVVASFLFTRYFQVSSYARTTVSINFEEIEEEMYPSGRDFSSSDIISPYVLGEALQRLGPAGEVVELQDLQEALTLEPLYYQEGDEEEGARQPLYQYRITLREHEGIPHSAGFKRRVLSSIVQSYRQNYYDDFIDLPSFPRLAAGEEELLQLDYPIVISILRTYQESMLGFLEEISESTEGFRSYRYGYSFPELEERLHRLKEMHFQDLEAQVNTYPLVKDKDAAVMQFREMIRALEMEERKSREKSLFVRELLEEARPMREGALLPVLMTSGVEEEGGILPVGDIFSRLYDDNFYMELIHTSMESTVEAIDKSLEIERLQRKIDRLEGPATLELGEEEVPEQGQMDEAEREAIMADLDEELQEFIVRMDEFSLIFNDMMWEFHEDIPKQQVSYVVTPYYMVETGNLQLNVAVAAVLGLMLGVFIVFFRHYWETSTPSAARQKEKENTF